MKHAILMTIYKDKDLINKLVSFYPSDFYVYIHIDAKSTIDICDIIKREKLRVFKKYKVNWGGCNHVSAFVFLLQKALNDGCDYYHWVTGQDAPVNPSTFDSRLKYGYSYLEFFKIPNNRWCQGGFYEGGLLRYQIFGLYDILDAKNQRQYRWIQKIEQWQKRHNFIRPFRDYSKLYGGSGYCTLFVDDVKVFIREFPKWRSFYKYTFCAEESIIQTILLNSERKKYIVNQNLRYIDWNASNPPKVLIIEDYDKIDKSKVLFCRKVDGLLSKELLAKLGI